MSSSPFSKIPVPQGFAVDDAGVRQRAERTRQRVVSGSARRSGLRAAIAALDLTTLSGADTPGRIQALCQKARNPAPALAAPPVAAVCVYPPFVRLARRLLQGSSVRVACVATAFPSGHSPLPIRLQEVRSAVEEGAQEVDMVISRGAFLAGHHSWVHDEIAATREACGEAHLKVILETGELETLTNVRLASEIAIRAGADFIKTSTGKVQPAATLEASLVMLDTIAAHARLSGKTVGFKPAGGIRTADEALHYLVAVTDTLGPEGIQADRFRFGASSLLTELLRALAREEQGRELSVSEAASLGVP